MKPVTSTFPSIKRQQTTSSGDAQVHGKTQLGAGSHSSIGTILVDSGRLSSENAERILRLQIEQDKRFGDTGLKLGLLTEEDIRFALSRQFDYLYLPQTDTSLHHDLIAAYEPFSPAVEKLRALRSQLMLRWFNGETRRNALAIMSPGESEGRSFIAANLAIVFSQLGERTLLIDADLRNPRQHKLFKLGHGGGLSGMLAGRNGTEVISRISPLHGLSVLPAGAVPPNPQELIGRPVFAELLQTLIQDFDIVIVDTPAANHHAEAVTLAVGASAALILARKNRSSVPDIVSLARSLEQTRTMLVGSVLNDF
ncbi:MULTISPECIES: chain length determinant protein tyrosine kinase EpsG [unclassified Nitrosospira]|uniref:chain length determinant protein tyrosine kinase EpsG n=1 Tax=unclassified Nitrosospira TaxID=2609267 RepID=UPI000D319D0D|nr:MULTISPECIES: chain length determinant protein tyrosine kinase EpsG [unclassified Nitrosospira]PTR15088.1 chain length determinant protein tyrosine kinase EpsG [Nitrosospira sp. Nsp2]WON72604.1 chain length determinant protein tyrosine kinase EpsG [Nitrosospira sp. Is2]